MKRITLTTLIILAFSSAVSGKVTPSSLVSDNMVLQQNAYARLWGKADPGESFTIITSWDGKTHTALADMCGDWSMAVPTPEGSYTPYTISIESRDGRIDINNVLVGEVWLASGQSNMEMPLKGFPGCCVRDGFKEIAGSRGWADRIRFFNVPLTQSYEPLDTVNGRWDIPSPETSPNFSAVAWHYAKQLSEVLDVPVGIVSAPYGGAKVESWMPRDLLLKCDDVSLAPDDIERTERYLRPMVMYNAMFHPVSNYTYKGIIWYQGCSNVSTYSTYAQRLADMVAWWRSDIGLGDIPFYAVEIAPYDYDSKSEDNKSPYLREAQWEAISMIPNSDMICINDLVSDYERHNIHPEQKEPVGRRLGELALNKTYGKKQFPAVSPRYKGHKVEGDKLVVAIRPAYNGICRNYDIRGFEIAGADGVYHPVKKVKFRWQTNEYELSTPEVPAPVNVRYCFRDFARGTVYGGNYLPLVPFRTDK